MMDYKHELMRKFGSRDAHVAVLGLGYVGLPLALACAEAGFRVTGIDTDQIKVDQINAGESYIPDIDGGALKSLVDRGAFSATSDYARIASCDAVSFCVPTPLNKTGDPDVSYIVSATEAAARYLHPGMVFILESTTYPGTTSEVVLPILVSEATGLEIGSSIFLAFSPERIDPGRKSWTTQTTPRVIGGVTPDCLEVAMAYYGQVIVKLVPVSSTGAAEMAKLLENTFRAINIGLANEILLMCDKLGLDVWEVIDAAATKPFGFMKFTPGPGIGGHCIPVDPAYLSWRLKRHSYRTRFIELATDVNAGMPAYWVQKVQDSLNEVAKPLKGSRVLVLGVTYKRDVDDFRESPSLDIIQLLREKGADVTYHDPHVPMFQHLDMEMEAVADVYGAIEGADCVVVVTDHSAYDWPAVRRLARLVVDTRHIVPIAVGSSSSMLPTGDTPDTEESDAITSKSITPTEENVAGIPFDNGNSPGSRDPVKGSTPTSS
jgi:UDP-N-acetyl-D-glucosamine dehydrogenase